MSNRQIASLRPSLLARKGGARPAMRAGLALAGDHHDLDTLALNQEAFGWNDHGEDHGAIHAKVPTRREVRRAAFTLRLDSQRHLKLRLASTIRNCSAQVLVTAALDHFLKSIPQIEALAAQASDSSDKN